MKDIQIGSRLERLQQMTEASRPQSKSRQKTSGGPRIASKQPMTAEETVASVRAEERSRIAAVFDSKQVSGNEYGAAFLLSKTDLTASEIISSLHLYPMSHSSFQEVAAIKTSPLVNSENHG